MLLLMDSDDDDDDHASKGTVQYVSTLTSQSLLASIRTIHAPVYIFQGRS
jgi:hypothetical protein